MSKAEILAELSNLKAEDRAQVFQRLCELQEQDLLQGTGPTAEEKQILDQALSEFEADNTPSMPWRQAIDQIRSANSR